MGQGACGVAGSVYCFIVRVKFRVFGAPRTEAGGVEAEAEGWFALGLGGGRGVPI